MQFEMSIAEGQRGSGLAGRERTGEKRWMAPRLLTKTGSAAQCCAARTNTREPRCTRLRAHHPPKIERRGHPASASRMDRLPASPRLRGTGRKTDEGPPPPASFPPMYQQRAQLSAIAVIRRIYLTPRLASPKSAREMNGLLVNDEPPGDRTQHPRLKRPMLYRLS